MLLRLIRAMLALRQVLDRRLGAIPLRVREFGLLFILATQGPLSQRALGAAMQVDRSSMVALLDRLEAAGYVERAAEPRDRRAHRILLTASGRRVLRRAFALVARLEAELWPAPETAAARQFRGELARLAAWAVAAAGGRDDTSAPAAAYIPSTRRR
ncbi:MAG TPA: MarR family transcriptional regulator [Terriglobales bacterium]|nr:MarR family transcriptional regulator [Terriglobales bacterium]